MTARCRRRRSRSSAPPSSRRRRNWPATCVPNRGTDDAPLFLINHWINTDPTPRPSDAAKVNARPVLVGRGRECARIRDRHPNLLAVDFTQQGDLYGAADVLNGVE